MNSPGTSSTPAALPSLLQDALRLHQAGRLDDAEARYREILAREPGHADALHYSGLLAYQQQRFDAAVDLIGRSLAVQADNPTACSNLGNALAMLGRLPEAEAAFRHALAVDPQFADACFNLGNLLRQQQALAAAAEYYRRAIALVPSHTGALNNLGNVLHLLGRIREAGDAFLQLGNVLQDTGQSEAAADAYRRSLALAPNPGVEVQLALLMPVIPMSVAEIDDTRERLVRAIVALEGRHITLPDPLRYASSAIFYTGYHGRNDRDLRQRLAAFHLRASPELAWTAPHCANYAGPGARIRVGFVSRFLHPDHPVGKYYGAIPDQIDCQRFEVVTFAVGEGGGMHSAGKRPLALPEMDLASARERVAAERLDVLFYPDIGMEPTTYFLAFGRLAPVQCVALGHPVTTGIPNIDYFLSAEALENPDADRHYSETLIRFPEICCYFVRRVPNEAGPGREHFGLPAEARIYVCAQNPIKIHPEFDATLAEILRRDSQGLLVLFNGGKTEQWGRLLLQRFQRVMPDVLHRVVVLPFLEFDAFLGFLRTVDATLDTPHFGGGTTSFEAFGVGVPIVTWPGAYARSRATHALYRQMGVTGLVAENAKQYVEIALRLARDPNWRTQMRSQLRERSHVLYENIASVRELEHFFEHAVAAAVHGQKLDGWPGSSSFRG